MWRQSVLIFLVLGQLHLSTGQGIWSCTEDSECSLMSGGICSNGACVCPVAQQPVLGGTLCADLAPYHTSTCVEGHQCSRMSFSFTCLRGNDTDSEGSCSCQPGHHYFLGRCWQTSDFGETCTRDEECLGIIRNPYSLSCNGTCGCAKGFYERQRGECREIGRAVGDGCVLNSDCQFEGGACDVINFACFDTNQEPNQTTSVAAQNDSKMTVASKMAARQHGVTCSAANPCGEPFECSSFGACLCPVGYYPSEDGSVCYAELGSPSTQEQCTGLLAVVRNGVCSCPANFFFDENMRDCLRVTRRITESCVSDASCFTFGPSARCGAPQEPWFLRSCECDPEYAVWDSAREMCRLFAGIGDQCEGDSDCLAGELEIQCLVDDQGQGYCACPEGFAAFEGLCLTLGLELGDACQATTECTGTPNTVCEDGRCSCDTTSYQEVDGVCAAIIGGVCSVDSDCVVANTQCDVNATSTCQCAAQFVEYDDQCWSGLSDQESECLVSAQCHALLGANSECVASRCQCSSGHHHRDGACWPITGIFEACSRTSQCFLSRNSDRVVCRNGLCQCDFDYPYSEELNTCASSASTAAVSIILLLLHICYIYLT